MGYSVLTKARTWAGCALAIILGLVSTGCALGERPPQMDPPDRQGNRVRSGIFCLPPRRPADALTAGPYALCAEYRAGHINEREYASALGGYGEMLVAMAALDTLHKSPGATARSQAEVVERLRENATLRTLCAAPSLVPFGTLVECAVLGRDRAASG